MTNLVDRNIFLGLETQAISGLERTILSRLNTFSSQVYQSLEGILTAEEVTASLQDLAAKVALFYYSGRGLEVGISESIGIGNPSINNSWRFTLVGATLVAQKKIAGNWVTQTTFGAITDETVKYDAGDPIAGYIADKFIGGAGITLAEGVGAQENKLVINTTALMPATAALTYAALNGTNQPFTGNLNISKTTPTITLTSTDDSNYTTVFSRSVTNRTAQITNAVATPSVTVSSHNVISSLDGVNVNEFGRIKLGDYSTITGSYNIYEGLSHNFNILGSAKGTMTGTQFSWTGNTLLTGATDAVQLKVKANVTQTTNPFEIETSTGDDILTVSTAGAVTLIEAGNFVLGTTTGTKFGTATSQKIGFFNATPIIQPIATTDIGIVLSNLGLRAAGTAYTLSTAAHIITGTSDTAQLKVIANATQTTDIFDIFASDGITKYLGVTGTGKLGIGVSPTYQLDILNTGTDIRAGNIAYTYTGSSAGYGLYNYSLLNNTTNGGQIVGYRSQTYTVNGATKTVTMMTGFEGSVQARAHATHSTLYGANLDVINDCPNTVTTAYGLRSNVVVSDGETGTITTVYGLYSNINKGTTGTITTAYGLYIPSISATTPWGLYVVSNNSLLGGNLTIGSGAAGIDYNITFDGETNNGVLTWMGDEDYFKFSDDIFMGTGEAVMFEATTTKLQYGNSGDLDVYTPANKTLELQTVVYNDLFMDVAPKSTGAGKPTLATFTGNIRKYTFAINDITELGTIELTHDWKEGTPIDVHVHWASNGTDVDDRYVKWEVDYTWANISSAGGTIVFAAATTSSGQTTIPTATNVDKTHYYTGVVEFTPTGGKIGAALTLSLKRIAASGTAPTNDPWCLMVGVHYQIDTIGSRSELTK
jgi:hypothetical protein